MPVPDPQGTDDPSPSAGADGESGLSATDTAPVAPVDGEEPVAGRARDARLRAVIPYAGAFVAYLMFAVWRTWPVPAHLTSLVFGTPGDASGNIALLRYRDELGVGPLSNMVTPLEGAPFGVPLPGVTSLPQVVVEGAAQLIALVSGSAVVAWNVMVIAGLTLSAFSCFVLCRHITRNSLAAFIAGLAFGFNPWILERAHGHYHFTHLWSLPMIVLGLLLVREGRRVGAGWLLTSAGLAAAAYTNTYITLFAGTLVAAFIIADAGAALLRRRRERVVAALRRAGIVAGVFVVVLIPQAIVAVTQAGKIDDALAGTRSPLDIYTYGARWWEWLVPSYRHPVFGDRSGGFLGARLHGSNLGETALYVGWSMILLAFVGVVVMLVRRRRGVPAWTAALGLTIVLAGLIVSLPAHVHVLGIRVPTPANVISVVAEPWRVYSRLFAVVMLGVAILAAIGAVAVFRRVPPAVVPVVALLLIGLVAFDLDARTVHFSAEAPAVYRALGDEPDAAPRVEYPLAAPITGTHLGYIFQTEAARRPLINGGRDGGIGFALNTDLRNPADPATPRALAALGARWMVLHTAQMPEGTSERLAPGFRRVGRWGTDELYRIIADPAPAVAAPADGFGPVDPFGVDLAPQRWLETGTGTIDVYNPSDAPVSVTVDLRAYSFATPRRLTIRQGDRIVFNRSVSPDGTVVGFDISAPAGISSLTVETTPGPVRVGSVTETDDQRMVSVMLSRVDVRSATRAEAPAAISGG